MTADIQRVYGIIKQYEYLLIISALHIIDKGFPSDERNQTPLLGREEMFKPQLHSSCLFLNLQVSNGQWRCVCLHDHTSLDLTHRKGSSSTTTPPQPSLSLCLSLPVWGRWADTALLSPSQSLCSAGAPSLGRSPSRTVWTVWNTAHTKRQPFRSTRSGYVSVMRLSSFTNYPSRLLIVYSVCWNRCCWKVQRNIPHFLHPCNS